MSKKPQQESEKAKAAYSLYESLEDRSFTNLIAAYQKRAEDARKRGEKGYVPSLTTIKNWSTTFGWQLRIKEYEDARRAARRRKKQKEIDRMDEDHALIARANLIKVQEFLAAQVRNGTISDSAAVSWFRALYTLERTARGAATERLEASGPEGTPLSVGIYPVMLPQKDPAPEDGEGGDQDT